MAGARAEAGRSRYRHPGHRVVNGQRLLQTASDIFLGGLLPRPRFSSG